MSDLISRTAALDAIDKNRQDLLSLGMDGAEHILVHYGRRVIENLPTTERVGKWIYKEIDDETGIEDHEFCSECGFPRAQIYGNFCAVCGARMKGDGDDN